MKKLFLLLSVGSIALSAGAQSNSGSIVLNHQYGNEGVRTVQSKLTPKTLLQKNAAGTAAKSTDGAAGDWFSFDIANDDGTEAITEGFYPLYPDSNLYVPGGTPTAFYWYDHGMGTSLDPTSHSFSDLWFNTTYAPPAFAVTAANAYVADSIEIFGAYHRKQNYTDTLFIDIMPARSDSGFIVTFTDGSLLSLGITGPDSVLEIASPGYDYAHNSIVASPSRIRITKVLDAAAASDTDANGNMDMVFPINVPVAAGGSLIAFTHFASGFQYPLGTNLDSANYWYDYSYNLNRNPLNTSGDRNGGLVAFQDERYQMGNHYSLSGTPILTPAYFYGTLDAIIHDPYYNIHLKCPTCVPTAVNNVTNISGVKAYPNPAANTVNVSYNLASTADVTISLTNTMGQVVASQSIKNATNGKAAFNTTALPAGVYAYSVIANGERTTGSVVVAH